MQSLDAQAIIVPEPLSSIGGLRGIEVRTGTSAATSIESTWLFCKQHLHALQNDRTRYAKGGQETMVPAAASARRLWNELIFWKPLLMRTRSAILASQY